MIKSRRPTNAVMLTIVCKQRPLCTCPTIDDRRSHSNIWIHPSATVKELKLAIQEQLNRNSQTNFELLDPARQVLFDPDEGHELQDQMHVGYQTGTSIKLTLKRLEPLPPPGPAPWTSAFKNAHTLARIALPIPNRPIRDVRSDIEIYKTGGNPAFQHSFAAQATAALNEFANVECDSMVVPLREWKHVDLVSDRSFYSKARAANGALTMMQRTMR